MRAFWLLLGRELRARRMLFAAALAIGLLSALVPALPGVHTSRPEEVRGAAAAVAAGFWGLALAIGLGASAVAGDLRERRLAFDFRLPASAAAIGAARVGAGLLTTLGASALVLAMSLPLGVELGFLADWLPFAPLALALLFLLTHAVTLSIAGERAWSALDFGSLFAVGIGVWLAWRPFYRYYVPPGELRLGVLVALLLALGLLVAIVFQIGLGRSELDRAHRAFSTALAGAALVVVLAAIGFARWYLTPSPEALVAARRAELGGGWTLTTGEARHRPGAAFALLRHEASGRALAPVPTPKLGWFNPYAAVAADGSRLAWLEIGEGRRDLELWTLDAREPRGAPRRALDGLEWSQEVWALSPDGTRTVSIGRLGEGRRLYCDEIATGRRLATLALPDLAQVRALDFVSAQRVRGRGWLLSDAKLVPDQRFFEVDLESGRFTLEPRK